MKSSAAKGSYWKSRTKKWLEGRGYQVAYLERMFFIYTARGQMPVKRDQFGSDLLAVNATEIVFVQVKGGTTRRDQLAAARRAFASFTFPAGTKQWLVFWAPKARQPEIEVVSEGPIGATEATLVIPKTNAAKRRKALPLFFMEA
jgi:hypothetical protein